MAYILTDKPKRTAGNAWLERVNPLHGLTIAQARNIFDVARAHGSPLLQKIYDEIELVDPVLGVCVDRRQAALAELGWKISPRPSADQVLADEQKDALDAFVRGIGNFSETVEHLDLAFFRGFSVVQPIWDGDEVHTVSLLETWNFLFDDDRRLLWNPDCTLDPRGCFEIPANARIVQVRRRRPIDYPALAIHIRKYLGERDWGRFIERYGIPPVDVVMAPNATNEQKADYVDAAEAARDGRSTVWPSGTPQPSRAEGSRGQDPFTAFIEHQEKLIVLRATGGTLTSLAQADTGTLAGGAQMDVWDQIVMRDSSVISDALNRQLFWKFLERRFPGRAPAVEFSIGRERELTANDAADLAVKLHGAGYTVAQAELEEATGFTLEKAPAPEQPGEAFNGRAVAPRPPLLNKVTSSINHPPTDPRAPDNAILEAFAKDQGAAAEAVAKLLQNPTPDRAAALLKDLPNLLPEDPALAAVIAEEMAKAYGEAWEKARKEAQPTVENKPEDQPRGKSSPESTPGSFVSADGTSGSGSGDDPKDGGEGSSGAPSEKTETKGEQQPESPKAKAKREKRERQAANKATGVANMATVTGGTDCPDFMRSVKLGRIAFYQGDENEGYLHIKNNPDADHQAMLQGDAIPNTLAYGKYYRDVYKGTAGWSVVQGDKCVFLGSDGDGVKIITAYVSKTKAAVFSRLTAIENKEM